MLDLDYEALGTHVAKLATDAADANELVTQMHRFPFFNAFETGIINAAEFRTRVRRTIGSTAPDHDIDQAWNSLLAGFNPDKIILLEKLARHCRLYLLSNTNPIHHEAFTAMFSNTFGGMALESLFEKAYYSHELRDRKPNVAVYRKLMQDNHLVPANTLFIDDSEENVKGARTAGMKTFHLQPPMSLLDIPLFQEVLL